MSNLIEQLFALEENRVGDAIILQDKSGNGAPNYANPYCIIQRINTLSGWQWCLRRLQYNPSLGGPSAGSGIYGDLNEMAKWAERIFGVKSDVREWVGVNYSDADFPANLLPF